MEQWWPVCGEVADKGGCRWETIGYDQDQKGWCIRADDQWWCADDSEEKRESCQLIHGGVLIGYGGSLMLSLVIRAYFVYGFRLIWNLSPSRVWLWLFEQGYKCRPWGNVMRHLSINQTQVFTHIPASTFRRLRHIFPFYYEFLGIRRLKLGVF